MKEFRGNHGRSGVMQQFILCSHMNVNGFNSDPFKWSFISSPSVPAAPDPTATAQAQTGSNQQTALYQAGLNDINQNTPLGSISYDINPGQTTGDGTVLKNPSTTSNITLNPLVQQDLTSSLTTANNQASLANDYQKQVANTMSTPYNLNSVGQAPTPDAAYQSKINANQNALEQPYIDRSNEQLQASLANQGITQGSQAYKNAMLDQSTSLNNLQEQNIQNATQQEASQFALQQQAYQQQLQNYSQDYTMPLNQLSALQSSSQVSQPSFSTPSATGVAGTNTAAITNQAYQNQLGASNAAAASNNQLLGGLFGLGGSVGSAAILASDRRLKTNIQRIGSTKQGIPVYRYKYRSGGEYQIGVMADELEKVMPHAVVTMSNGYKAVKYGEIYGNG